jgi:hypothetical protein
MQTKELECLPIEASPFRVGSRQVLPWALKSVGASIVDMTLGELIGVDVALLAWPI